MASSTDLISITPLSDKGFYAFAPEIREMIFQQHFAESWDGFDGETPALIQALRKSKLYIEAVDAFTGGKSFKLHEGNGWDLEKMALVFSKLEIAISSSGMGSIFTVSIPRIFRPEIVWKVKNIRYLTMQTNLVIPCTGRTSSYRFRSPQVTRAFADILAVMKGMQLTELRVLNLALLNDYYDVGNPALPDLRFPRFEYPENELVELLSTTLNREAVLTQVEGSVIRQEWRWRCEAGSFLTF